MNRKSKLHSFTKNSNVLLRPNKNVFIDDNNPILTAFKFYRDELDTKHDRYERLVKLSRDITIESKRNIFLLQSIDLRKNNCMKICSEVQQRLEKLMRNNFQTIAKELNGQDSYQYRGAYSIGLQEFIEAYTFMIFLKNSNSACHNVESELPDWISIQRHINNNFKNQTVESLVPLSGLDQSNFVVEPTDYILGLSDLGGELMRRCINALGSGDIETCYTACFVLQQLYKGMNMIRFRELSRKTYTMYQSVLKAEHVCYDIKMRGGEAAKRHNMFDKERKEEMDEGFF